MAAYTYRILQNRTREAAGTNQDIGGRETKKRTVSFSPKQVLDHKPLYFLHHKSFTDHAMARTK